jgi:hypothetical protein
MLVAILEEALERAEAHIDWLQNDPEGQKEEDRDLQIAQTEQRIEFLKLSLNQ